jgi:5-(carboxyamino)imidazole ribonucleotide synthase
MLALAGYRLDLRFLFLDPSPGAPAGQLSEQVVADYEDENALAQFARATVCTYEFESVPERAALRLAELGASVLPHPRSLSIAQDRLVEKRCFRQLGIPTAAFVQVDSVQDLDRGVAECGLPCVIKTCRFGYDGKGQALVRHHSEAHAAYESLGGVPMIVEKFIRFERELSIVAARGQNGEVVVYPLFENHHREGILRLSLCPAPTTSEELQIAADRYVNALLKHLDYTGVLALELFQVGGQLFANEFAPRVHNSAHATIEAARTSQFENHLRAILGFPLGSSHVPRPAAMLNLIGGFPDPARVLALDDVHLHVYGKEARRSRKVGHITVLADDPAELQERIATLQRLIAPSQDG